MGLYTPNKRGVWEEVAWVELTFIGRLLTWLPVSMELTGVPLTVFQNLGTNGATGVRSI